MARSYPIAPPGVLVGKSACMRQLWQQVARLGDCDVSVLLLGESGTGKELIARAIHALSDRREGPFVGVNCAAIHESLLEAELFGHEAGAFTGAAAATQGFLRATDGGTILLDEIGDMSRTLQSKLLRTLEERAVTPVGGTKPIPIDVRVISATHHNLPKAVEEGRFRLDLYYRLNVVCLRIPPLRDRGDDVAVLADHMLGEIAATLHMPPRRLSDEVLEAMQRYDWPGNVRELGNVIQRAYVLSEGPTVELADLPEELRNPGRTARGRQFLTLQDAVRRHVEEALRRSGGVRTLAAGMLGIDRKSLYRMTQRWQAETT